MFTESSRLHAWAGIAVALAGLATPLGAAEAQCSNASSGAEIYGWNADVGGGAAYPRRVSRSSAHHVVATRAQLLGALSQATFGQIIYVEDSAAIDLSSDFNISIPRGVTLASGRGTGGSPGGLLYTTSSQTGLFLVFNEYVRVTGLRIMGNYMSVPNDGNEGNAFHVMDVQEFEMDNCELFGWAYAGVLADNSTVDVHHNHIHHNRRQSLGYGVVLAYESKAWVESNIFDHNRHDIAGSGHPMQEFYARYNLVIGQNVSHSFDMHGEQERWLCPSRYAGGTMFFERNTFVDPYQQAVRVRGAPYDHGYVMNNRFNNTVADKGFAIRQAWPQKRTPDYDGVLDWEDEIKCEQNPYVFGEYTRVGGDYERMTTDPNCFDYVGWYRFDTKYGGFYPLAQSSAPLANVRFGNFNSDSKADVFTTDNGEFRFSSGGTSGWTTLATSSYSVSQLAFGNFVGDSRTDVFRANGNAWFVSNAGSGSWQQLSAKGDTLSSLIFADFNNDRVTDVFRSSNGLWQVSYGGTSAWTTIGSSSYALSALRFGDFNGDGRADILRRASNGWYVSYSGSTGWTRLNTLNDSLSVLAFGDFVGDGRTDMLKVDGSNTWYVSDGGQSGWQEYALIEHGVYTLDQLGFADFTGDGKLEAFLAGTP